MTTLLYLMACLMSPAPLINLAESRVSTDLGFRDPQGFKRGRQIFTPYGQKTHAAFRS